MPLLRMLCSTPDCSPSEGAELPVEWALRRVGPAYRVEIIGFQRHSGAGFAVRALISPIK